MQASKFSAKKHDGIWFLRISTCQRKFEMTKQAYPSSFHPSIVSFEFWEQTLLEKIG